MNAVHELAVFVEVRLALLRLRESLLPFVTVLLNPFENALHFIALLLQVVSGIGKSIPELFAFKQRLFDLFSYRMHFTFKAFV